jgi:RNA polymerase sigma-70 factor (ECF subfamily)
MNQGDSEFAALLKQQSGALAGFVLAVVGDRQAMEDIFQSTCLELWRIRKTFTLGTDFGAWSRTVARYQVKRYLQKTGREKVAFSSAAVEHIAETYAHPKRPAEDTELRRALKECLALLSESHKALLKQRYNHGTAVRITAEKIGKTESALKMMLVRIRRSLRNCITGRMKRKDRGDD